MTAIVVTQPNYIPWFGWFALTAQAETVVLLDTVQMTRQDWRSRNRILLRSSPTWLSIPVVSKARLKTTIADTLISPTHRDWGLNHWKLISETYKCYRHFTDVESLLLRHYSNSESLSHLVHFTIPSTLDLLSILVPKVTVITASSMFHDEPHLVGIEQSPNSRLLEICKKLNATQYVSSIGAMKYLDTSAFEQQNVDVFWFDQKTSVASALSIVHDIALFGVKSIRDRIDSIERR